MLLRIKNLALAGALLLGALAPARAAIAPSPVTDLRVVNVVVTGFAASSMTVTLNWTAPGEEGGSGILNGFFTIRWSSYTPITSDPEYDAANYSADVAAVAVNPGTNQATLIGGLDRSATHYFVIKTTDSEGLTSGLSNGATQLSYRELLLGSTHYGRAAAWGDCDNDGDLDLWVANSNNDFHSVFTNNGGVLTLTEQPAGSDRQTRGIAWCDLNNDGLLDMAIANTSGQDEDVFINQGACSFTRVPLAGTGGNTRGVACGDYDNDGDYDLAFSETANADEYIAKNLWLETGTVSFSTFTIAGSTGDSRGIAWGDYDNDGFLDLFIANTNGQDTVIARNLAGVGFSTAPIGGSIGVSRGLGLVDYDDDGYLDAVVVNRNGDAAYLLKNAGVSTVEGGRFSKHLQNGSGGDSFAVNMADIDNDGDWDIVVGNVDGEDEYVLINNDSNDFDKLSLNKTSGATAGLSLGDYDDDGDLDAVIVNQEFQQDFLLRNDAGTANAAPTPPTIFGPVTFAEFSPYSSSGTVAFEWSGMGDDQTTDEGLRFWIRAGTTTAGSSTMRRVPSRFSFDGYSGGPSYWYSNYAGDSAFGTKLVMQKGTTVWWAVTPEDAVYLRGAESAEQTLSLAAPNPVTDLQVAVIQSTGLWAASMTVTLTWSAPGADGAAGVLPAGSAFDIRYSSFLPIAAGPEYAAAAFQQVIATSSVNPGERQSATIAGLAAHVSHYFLITTVDEIGVRSALSNAATAQSYVLSLQQMANTRDVAFGDYDGDGDLDIAVAQRTGGNEIILKQGAGGTWTQFSIPTGGDTYAVAWGDYDNDGDLDLAISNRGGEDERIARNDGGDVFTLITPPGTGGDSRGIAWGDYDNDGDLDLLVANASGQDEVLISNEGGDVFSTMTLTGTGGETIGVAWGDHNDDGWLDFAAVNYDNLVADDYIATNNGDGTFTTAVVAGNLDFSLGAAWGDLDGDGDLDVMVASDGNDRWFRNDGGGVFTALQVLNTGQTSAGIALGDIDNDGDLDAVVANNAGAHSIVLQNNGGGVFVPRILVASDTIGGEGVSLGDIDNDGDLDMVQGNTDLDVHLYRNDGNFAANAPTAPTVFSSSFTEFSVGSTSGVFTMEWTPAGDVDAATATLRYFVRIGTSSGNGEIFARPARYGQSGYGGGFLHSWKIGPVNLGRKLVSDKGAQIFWAVTTEDGTLLRSSESAEQAANLTAPDAITDLQAAVVQSTAIGGAALNVTLTWSSPGDNGDSDPIVGGAFDIRYSTTGPITTFADYAAAGFQVLAASDALPGQLQTQLLSGLDPAATHYFRVTTLDSIGVRAGLSNQISIAGYAAVAATGTAASAYGTAFADIDRDGDLDIVLAHDAGLDEVVLYNHGDGTFSAGAIAGSAGNSRGLGLADFDNDGDLDIAVANFGQDQKVLRNDGGGNWIVFTLTGSLGDSQGLAVGDLDRDGHMDFVTVDHSVAELIFHKNDGTGDMSFTTSTISGGGTDSRGVALCDFNADGWLDIAVSNFFGQNVVVMQNNQDGTFTDQAVAASGGNSYAIACADIEGDGDLDMVVANDGGNDYALRNDGAFAFTKIDFTGTAGRGFAAAWGDFDNDGDPDALIGNYGSGADEALMINNGGAFERHNLFKSSGNGRGVSIGDYDGDGDLDVAASGFDEAADILLRNDASVSPSAPTAPSVLNSSFTPYSIFASSGILSLWWGDGADAQTPAAALEYLVRVGTTVAGSSTTYKIPPPFRADGYSGGGLSLYSTRLSPSQRGLRLQATAETTYYWAVAAEDGMFLRSGEAAEQTVNLTAPRAIADLAAAANTTINTSSHPWINLTFTSPGEDNAAGDLQAGAVYDIRWSTTGPISTAADYLAAPHQLVVSAQGTANTATSRTLEATDPTAAHYFALTTVDSLGVRSGLSNAATFTPILLKERVYDTAVASTLQGTTTGFLRVDLWTESGSVQWTGLRLRKTGGLADAAVTQIGVYQDSNSNGLFDAVDIPALRTTPATFVSSQAALSFSAIQTIDTSTKTYFVAAAFSPTFLPVVDSSVSIQLDGEAFQIRGGGVYQGDYPAMLFDGVDDRTLTFFNAALNVSTITLEAWVKTADGGANRSIATRNGPASGWRLALNADSCGAGVPSLTIGDQTLCANAAGTPVSVHDGNWHHIAAQYSPTAGKTMFVDGVPLSTETTAGTIADASNALGIGGPNAVGGNTLDGVVDELRISNTLRYSTAAAFVPARRNAADGNTQALYHFDSTGGNPFNTQDDASGNGLLTFVQSGAAGYARSSYTAVTDNQDVIFASAAQTTVGVMFRNAFNVPMLRLKLWAQNDTATLNDLTVTSFGSGSDGGVTNLQFFRDNGDDSFSPVSDTALISGINFGGGAATFDLAGSAVAQEISVATKTYFIVWDVGGGAELGKSIGLELATTEQLTLAGGVDTIDTAAFPLRSSAPIVVAADTFIIPELATGTWVNFSSAVFRPDFTSGNVDRYHFAWDQNPLTNVDGGDPSFSSGKATFTATADAADWYFHVRPFDAASSSGPQTDFGPFFFDRTPPSGSNFAHAASSGGLLAESQFNLLASGVTAQLTLLDLASGANVDGPAPVAVGSETMSLWRFDETSGTTMFDSGPSGNDLAVGFGTLARFPGRFGGGQHFDGATYLIDPSPQTLPVGNAGRTVAAWVNPRSTTGALGILSWGPAGQDPNRMRLFGGRLSVDLGGGYVERGTPLSTDTWHHVAYTFDGANTNFYVDGQFVGTNAQGAVTTGLAPLHVGRTDIGENFHGELDEIRVLNRALSQGEIEADYERGDPFYVTVSTDAGASWLVLAATAPTGFGHVALNAAQNQNTAQTLFVRNLLLRNSTSTLTGAGGTNQLRFHFYDAASNLRISGPFTVLVDSNSGVAVSTPNVPVDGAYADAGTGFYWIGPSTTLVSGMQGEFYLEVDDAASFATPVISISTPALADDPGLDRTAGRYVSTYTLTEATTYYWRVRSRSQFGVFGPYSQVKTFVVDATSPTGAGFQVSNSTGGFFPQGEAIDLINGATASLQVQDVLSGLAHGGEFAPIAGTQLLYHFDEVDGAFPQDASGNANHGALATGGAASSSATYAAGFLGSSLECRNSQFQFVRAPAPFVPIHDGPLTIQAWVRPDATSGFRVIAGQGSPIGGGSNYVFLVNNGRLDFKNATGGGFFGIDALVDEGVWQFVAVVASGTHISFYKNGQLIDSGVSASGGIDTGQTMDFTVCAGLDAANVSNSHFHGAVDELRVITRVRTPEEIAADYEAGKRGRFAVEVSSNAGNNWTVVSATTPSPGYPHLALSGPEGTPFAQTLTVRDLQLVHSTNVIVGAGATNMVRFTQTDLAGRRETFGPFAVIVDTVAAALISTPTAPGSGVFVGYGPNFNWDGPSTGTVFQMESPARFLLEVDDANTFLTPVISVSTPAVIESTSSPNMQGLYVSTFALAHNTTYFWRVRSPDFLGIQSPARTVASFVTDFASPTTSGFASRSSTFGLVAEAIGSDIALGATAQILVRDTGPSGLSTKTVDGVRLFGVMYTTQGAAGLPVWIDGERADAFTSTISDDVTALGLHQGALFAGTGPSAEIYRFTHAGGWGLSGDLPGVAVTDLESFQGELYATVSGDGQIMRYTGVWTPFFDTQETGGGAIKGYRGRLYAGMSGVGRVWVYDPVSTQWTVSFVTGDSDVTALAVYQGRLFAGTDNAIYEFNGSFWSLSLTVGAAVNDMEVYNGRLYAATSNSGQVRELNGTTWSVHFDPAETDAGALGVHDGRLYVGVGNPSNGRVYVFDGNTANNYMLVHTLPAAGDRVRDFIHYDKHLYTAARVTPSSGVVFVSTPAALTLSGPDGSTLLETAQVTGLNLVNSGNSVVCGGLQGVCAASNQVRFTFGDRAGRVHASGSYAILVDTLLNPPTIAFPLDFSYEREAGGRYSFHESTVQPSHNVQWSRFSNFGIIDVSVTNAAPFLQPSPTLNADTTYYWRVRAQNAIGIFSNFSSSRVVFTDYSAPTLSAFRLTNATGGLVGASQFTNLASGVTVQIDAQDAVSGLPLRPAGEGAPVGYWPFQENVGTLARSAAGAGPPAYMQNGGMWTSSKRGIGIDTSGNVFVDVSSPTAGSWNGLTVMMWARPVSDAGFRTLWSNNQIQFHTLGSNNRVDFGLRTTGAGGCQTAVTPRVYAVGQWQHVAFVADPAANENRIYINGELRGSCAGAAVPVDSPLRLGADGLTGIGGVDFFTGEIDEARLYNRAVAPHEIADEARSTRYWVAYSTTAGQTWSVVGSTLGAGGRLSEHANYGTFALETVQAIGVDFSESTNTTTCVGAGVCGASNQARVFVADRAGNVGDSTIYSVRVDTSVPLPTITSVTPLSTSEVFVTAIASDPLSGLGDYLFEASTSPAFAPPLTTSGFVAIDSHTFTGLLNQTTYFFRVTARDNVLNLSTPSVAVATQTFGTVFYTTAPVVLASAEQNALVPMLRFHLNTPAGIAKFSSLVVQLTGLPPDDADITQARIYRDNGDGVFAAGDDTLLAGSAFSGGLAGLAFATPENIGVAISTYFVVYQMASGATVGNTVGLNINLAGDVGLLAPAFAQGNFPTVVTPIPITDGSNSLTVNFTDLAPVGGATPNSSNVPMLRLDMVTDVGTSELSQVVLRLVGTMPSNEISAIRMWRDADADGLFNAGLDADITPTPGVFTAGVSTLSFGGAVSSRTVGSGGERYFLTFDIALGATQGNTFQVLISSESELSLGNILDTVVFPIKPVESATGTVIVNNILSVTPRDTTPAQFTQGARYAVITATMSVDTGNADINRVSVDRTGAGVDGDVQSVEIYRDQTLNGGPFTPLVDIFLGSAPFSGGRADVDITTTTVTAGATTVLFVVYRVAPGANPGNELGASWANNTFITPANPATAVEGPFPFTTSTAPITATINTMLIPTALSVAPGGLEQGAADVPMLRLDAVSSQNNFSWLGLTLDRLGTGADADVASLSVFIDNGATAGVFDSSDTRITSGGDAFAGGSAAVALTAVQTITASTQTYFVTMSIAPTAVPGTTLGVRISSQNAFNVSAPNIVDPSLAVPVNAGPVPVTQFANTVSVSTASIAPLAGAEPGISNIGMMALELNTDVSNADFLSLQVEEVGSAADSEVAAVKVYFDINGIGAWDGSNLAQYQLVSLSTQSFGDVTPNFVTLNFSTPPALTPSLKRFFVVVDLASAAVPGNQVILRAIDNTSFQVNPPNFMAPTSYLSQPLIINAPPETMFVVPRGTAPATVTQGDANVVMEAFDLVMSSYSGSLSRITVTRAGSGLDSDVSSVKLYADANADGALQVLSDVRLATAVFSGGSVNLDFAAQTINTLPRRFFVTYDIAQTAVAGNTLATRMAAPGAFVIAAPNSVAALNFPLQSTSAVILPTIAGMQVQGLDQAPGQLLQGATNQVMLRLSLSTTEHAVLWSGLTVRSTGTAADSDIAAINIWEDVNVNNILEPGLDTRITSGLSSFLGGQAVVSLTQSQTIGTAVRRYLVSVDVAPFANPDNTFGLVVESTSSFSLNSPNYTQPAGLPSSSFIVDINKLPEQLRVTPSDLTPVGGMNQGFETVMARIDAAASRSLAQWTQLRLARTGNLGDAEVDAMVIYRDSDLSGTLSAGDLVVGSNTFSAGQATIVFSSAQTVAVATQTYFVAAQLNVAATVGASFGFSIPSADFLAVAIPDTVDGSNLPFATTLAQVLDSRTPTQPVVNVDGAVSSNFEFIHFTWQSSVATGTLVGAEYAIGVTPGGQETVAWTPIAASQTDFNATGFPIVSGSTYYVSVRAESDSGFKSPVGTSIGILMDFTIPAAPAPTATAGDTTILLTWGTVGGGPSGILGYLVEYQTGDVPQWKNAKNGSLSPAGFGTEAVNLAAAISSAAVVTGNSFQAGGIPGGTVLLRMRTVSGAGLASAPSPTLKLQLGPLPKDGISNVSNYPNPFDSRKTQTTFHYVLSANADVSIKIYSVFGRLIKEINHGAGVNGGQAGSNNVAWDGTDEGGRKVSKGMYIGVIQSGGAKETLKIGVIH